MIYGYARVSTAGQVSGGNGLEAQINQLRDAGAEYIYTDTFTGTTMERPEFTKLRHILKSGDTLIIAKLDRLGRSVSQASAIISELIEEGITINVLNVGVLSNDSVNKLIQNILLAFAQFERDMIVQRTQEGKAIAKQNPNYREGRPRKYTRVQMDHAMELLETHSYTQVANMTGIGRATLSREKKRRQLNYEENRL